MAQQTLINIKLMGENLQKSQIKILYFTNECSEFVFKYLYGAIRVIRKPSDSNGTVRAFTDLHMVFLEVLVVTSLPSRS